MRELERRAVHDHHDDHARYNFASNDNYYVHDYDCESMQRHLHIRLRGRFVALVVQHLRRLLHRLRLAGRLVQYGNDCGPMPMNQIRIS